MSKKEIEPKPLTESEREELIRLRGEKAAIIKALRAQGYWLKVLLDAMKMAKSTYYYEISKVNAVDLRNTDLTDSIVATMLTIKGFSELCIPLD